MNDPITDRVAQILSQSGHILVPFDVLYDELASEGLMSWISPEFFETLLLLDERFDVVEGFGATELLGIEEAAVLDAHGFLGGPRVMLRSRATPPEALMLDILFHLKEMNRALEMAWQRRPDDPDLEAELIQMLMLGDMLERELQQALDLSLPPEESFGEMIGDAGNGG